MKTFLIEYEINGQTFAEHVIAFSEDDAKKSFSARHSSDGAGIKSVKELPNPLNPNN